MAYPWPPAPVDVSSHTYLTYLPAECDDLLTGERNILQPKDVG